MKFEEMTAPEIRSLDKETILVVLPIAACEQHGPHMPTGTDTIICNAVAEGVEQENSNSVLLLPTLWLGASRHHLRWGATLSTGSLATYTSILTEILEPLLEDGYRRVLLLNGHGGNIDPMRVAVRTLQPTYPEVLLTAASYWSIAEAEIAELMEGEVKSVGHACEAETSLIMHLRPELVSESMIENFIDYAPDNVDGVFICQDMKQRTAKGATGRPDLASAAKGAQMFNSIVSKVSRVVDNLCRQTLPSVD